MPKKITEHADIGRVEYVKRKKQRSIRISLKPGVTRVSMPYYATFRQAEKFLESRLEWIKANKQQKQDFTDGMHIGKSYVLSIKSSSPNRSSIKNGLITVSGTDDHIKKTAVRALKKESEVLITKRLAILAQKTGLNYKDAAYKHMTSRWGSCTSDKKLTFSVLLVQLPWHLIDYVILHELCHTLHMNHSKDFWEEVARHCPEYKKLRKELRTYQPVIYNTAYGYKKG